MDKRFWIVAIALTLSASIVPSGRSAADWPHWRGPHRNGISPESSGFREGRWNLEEVWHADVGEGSSSPLVVGEDVYVMGWRDDREVLRSIGLRDGVEQWKQSYPAPRYGRHSQGDKGLYAAVCSTPEFDSTTGFLYTLGIDGELCCWDTANKGEPVWQLNLYDRFAPPKRPEVAERGRTRRDYGFTTAPLVHQDLLLVEVGATDGTVYAFDKRSGEVRWRSEINDPAGHTGGPVLMDVEGRAAVVVLTLRNVVVISIDGETAGRTIAAYPWTTDYGNNIATPAVYKNSIVVTSAYNHYAMCRLDLKDGELTPRWEIDNPSGVCTPIIDGEHVYWAWRGVHCVDWDTGDELWQGGRVGSAGSCIKTADDRLIVYANRGDLILVETAARSAAEYQEIASQRGSFRQDAWPHVVLSQRQLLIRDQSGNLKAIRIGD